MTKKQTFKTSAEAQAAMLEAKKRYEELQALERQERAERRALALALLDRIEEELGPGRAQRVVAGLEKLLGATSATGQNGAQKSPILPSPPPENRPRTKPPGKPS